MGGNIFAEMDNIIFARIQEYLDERESTVSSVTIKQIHAACERHMDFNMARECERRAEEVADR